MCCAHSGGCGETGENRVRSLRLGYYRDLVPTDHPPTITTVIFIDAAPERVWQVLTGFARYHEWHPLLEVRTGTATPGAALSMRIAAGTEQERSAEGTVIIVDEPKLLVWEGGMPDVLWGRHSFELEPEGSGTRVTNSEAFTGSMAHDIISASRELLLAEFRAADDALRNRITS